MLVKGFEVYDYGLGSVGLDTSVCVCDVLGLIEWTLLYWVKSNLKGWKAKMFVDGLIGYATKQRCSPD